MNNYEDLYVEKTLVNDKKPFPIYIDGIAYTIYGGSCHLPKIDDATLYVSLDEAQPVYSWEQPWNATENKKHLRFPIEDMFIPTNSAEFINCVEYVSRSLKSGAKVHVGCIGGYGRTGMFFSALVQHNMKNHLASESEPINAIEYVRKHYSKLAVETVPQLIFLNRVYDIAIPDANKEQLQHFIDVFAIETGTSSKEIFSNTISMDQLTPTLKDIESLVISELEFSNRTSKDFFSPKIKKKK